MNIYTCTIDMCAVFFIVDIKQITNRNKYYTQIVQWILLFMVLKYPPTEILLNVFEMPYNHFGAVMM